MQGTNKLQMLNIQMFKLFFQHIRLDFNVLFLGICLSLVSCFLFLITPPQVFAQSVELNGDLVEYSVDGNTVTAEGNVIIEHQGTRLECDKVTFLRNENIAYAEGNVRLKMEQGEISGETMTYNFATGVGDFKGAKIASAPFYGKGQKITRINEKEIVVEGNYITTCDHDKPHFHLASKKMEMYPGEKLVARSAKMVIGKLPILYFPRFTQRLDNEEPWIVVTPGYTKDWGAFLLTKMNLRVNEHVTTSLHLDAREKKDIASGFDVDYTIPGKGEGSIETYYMNERNITSKRFYEERPSPTIERERFKVEWRHKWDIDDSTNAILQYYRLSDSTFLKDYFEKEYEEDSNPATFMVLTKAFPVGTLSLQAEARVNRFTSAIERLPEIRYDLPSTEIADTGFYFKNISTFSNLASKSASPSEVRLETKRMDVDSEISYPKKVGIIEFTPFVGGSHTYYSKTNDPTKYNSIRGTFRTGAILSTKFYRIFEYETDRWGLDINRLRHIITPTVTYNYDHDPTIDNDVFDNFDSIDTKTRKHSLLFEIENKLQTKRDDKSVDLLRAIVGVDFRLKEDPGKGGFGDITADMDFLPTDWLSLYFDSSYDTKESHLKTANFELQVHQGEKWSWNFAKRFNRDVDDLITTEFMYKINPKWTFRVYERFDVDGGNQKEQEFQLRRDMHEWIMDINFNETRTEGSEIWLVFTLKAFPDIALDFGTNFNQRKAGSQSE